MATPVSPVDGATESDRPATLAGPLRATAILAVGSGLSLLAGAASAKAVAVLAGTVGVGAVGLFSSLLTVLVLVGGAGFGVAAVRLVAGSLSVGDPGGVRATVAAARRMTLLVSSLLAVLVIVAREPLSAVLFGSDAPAAQVGLVGAAVPLLALAGVEVAIVNGFHNVRRLALVTATTALATAATLVAGVGLAGTDGVAPGLLGGAISALVIARAATWGLVPASSGSLDVGPASRRLANIGLPYVGSQLLGTGAQMLIPFVVLSLLSASDVGLYRAATTLSVAYLAFLLNAMAQDYYPRLAGARGAPDLRRLAQAQLQLVMAIAAPIVLVAIAVAPIAIQVFYSNAFAPATDLLRWQLIGDLVKLPAWVLSFVILARGSGRRFLVVEAVGGVAYAVLATAGIALLGLEGAGIAYLATYVIYFVAVLVAARPFVGDLRSKEHGLLAGLAVGCILGQVARPAVGDLVVSGVMVTVALAWAGLVSLPVVRGRPPGWLDGASRS